MFGIGMPELLVIFVIALLVFGPKELPKIGRTIGKAMGELRRASDELKEGIQREIDLAEREQNESAKSPETPSTTVPTESPAVIHEPVPEPQLELPIAQPSMPRVASTEPSTGGAVVAAETTSTVPPARDPKDSVPTAQPTTHPPAETTHVG